MTFDGAQRSICCSSLKTNKKQILRSAQDDMLGGFFSSLLVHSNPIFPLLTVPIPMLILEFRRQHQGFASDRRACWDFRCPNSGFRMAWQCFQKILDREPTAHGQRYGEGVENKPNRTKWLFINNIPHKWEKQSQR